MFFGFTDDQLAFRDAVRDLLADACPPAAVRDAWTPARPAWDSKLWARLAEMGVLGALAPAEDGGLGLDEIDTVLLWEETGRAATPGPVLEHAAVAVPLLAAAGEHALAAAAASGDVVVTFGAGADRVGWAAEADVLLVVDRTHGVRLVRAADRTSTAPLDVVDRSRRDAGVGWSDAALLAGADVALALDRAALGAAAQLCGLATHLVDVTVSYAQARRQFGAPIGTYQAIKHHLADAALHLEHARPAVYRAAYSVARGAPTRTRDVSMAKVMASTAADIAARVALQCHGAIGYTWEHDLHLWMKRVWVLTQAWGGPAVHRARVADAVIGDQ